MQEQIGAKMGAFVFFCFGVMMLALSIWGMTTQYDQGGILTWGIVLGFGVIFALTGVVLFINSMKNVSDRVKQLGGSIVGSMVCLGFGVISILADGLGILRFVLVLFGFLGVWILVQGIRNFIKGDSADADQTSGGIQWSSDVGGNMNGQEVDGYQSYQTSKYSDQYGEYNSQSGYDSQYTTYGSPAAENSSPDTDVRQDPQWQQGTPGTPFSGSAGSKVYTSQVSGNGTGYGSSMSPEFEQMINGVDFEQQEKVRKIGSAVQKGANIYAGIICIVIGAGFTLTNSIIVFSFIIMLIRTASFIAVISSLFSTMMSVVMLIIGIFMIVRGVKILQGKIKK